MEKTHIYCIPGLGASTKIFEFISLPENLFDIHLLEWMVPLSVNESIENYAQRMCKKIRHKKPVLMGVSFGGVMAQEMSKQINTKKVIIVSSIKSQQELPKRLQLAKVTKAYKLLPTQLAENFEEYTKYFLGDFLQKRADLYKKYMGARNSLYLNWAIHNILHWQQKEPLANTVHIHGNKDGVFPLKYIKNAISIDKGTHIMILNKAKTISKIIEQKCVY